MSCPAESSSAPGAGSTRERAVDAVGPVGTELDDALVRRAVEHHPVDAVHGLGAAHRWAWVGQRGEGSGRRRRVGVGEHRHGPGVAVDGHADLVAVDRAGADGHLLGRRGGQPAEGPDRPQGDDDPVGDDPGDLVGHQLDHRGHGDDGEAVALVGPVVGLAVEAVVGDPRHGRGRDGERALGPVRRRGRRAPVPRERGARGAAWPQRRGAGDRREPVPWRRAVRRGWRSRASTTSRLASPTAPITSASRRSSGDRAVPGASAGAPGTDISWRGARSTGASAPRARRGAPSRRVTRGPVARSAAGPGRPHPRDRPASRSVASSGVRPDVGAAGDEAVPVRLEALGPQPGHGPGQGLEAGTGRVAGADGQDLAVAQGVVDEAGQAPHADLHEGADPLVVGPSDERAEGDGLDQVADGQRSHLVGIDRVRLAGRRRPEGGVRRLAGAAGPVPRRRVRGGRR